ncbi:MAG: hypothetical protein KDK36_01990 [Leptospiraceae bacterium]|nr:hypothetical protein [Leptospiraceae bacterium]
MIASEIPDYENLNRNFFISMISFLFLVWFIFLAFPGSDIGTNYSSLPYGSALLGWNTNLLYGLLSCLFASFIWMVYLGLCMLRDNEFRTNTNI